MKTVISKTKLKKVEDFLYVGFGAFGIVISMEKGNISSKAIKIRNKVIKDIMNLLNH